MTAVACLTCGDNQAAACGSPGVPVVTNCHRCVAECSVCGGIAMARHDGQEAVCSCCRAVAEVNWTRRTLHVAERLSQLIEKAPALSAEREMLNDLIGKLECDLEVLSK